MYSEVLGVFSTKDMAEYAFAEEMASRMVENNEPYEDQWDFLEQFELVLYEKEVQ